MNTRPLIDAEAHHQRPAPHALLTADELVMLTAMSGSVEPSSQPLGPLKFPIKRSILWSGLVAALLLQNVTPLSLEVLPTEPSTPAIEPSTIAASDPPPGWVAFQSWQGPLLPDEVPSVSLVNEVGLTAEALATVPANVSPKLKTIAATSPRIGASTPEFHTTSRDTRSAVAISSPIVAASNAPTPTKSGSSNPSPVTPPSKPTPPPKNDTKGPATSPTKPTFSAPAMASVQSALSHLASDLASKISTTSSSFSKKL